MKKITLFSIAILIQLCILIILGYVLDIRLYLYGDILDSNRIKGILPPLKPVNKLGTAALNRLDSQKANDLSAKLMKEAKVIVENGKPRTKFKSEIPGSQRQKNIKVLFKRPNENISPERTKNLHNEKQAAVMLSKHNNTILPATTKIKTPKNLLFSDLIEQQKVVRNVELLIMVLTAPSKFQRRRNIRKTWWKECHNQNQVACWFFTDPFDSITEDTVRSEIQKEQAMHKDIIFTPVKPGINFGFRFLYIIQWATRNYNFNYTLRIDDDVMLCVDHLMWDLPHFPPQNVHYGWLHCQVNGIVYMDEGVAMFSNDVIAKFLAQDADKILCHPFGDQQISIWEQEIGLNQTEIIRMDNERIHHSPPASYDENIKKISNLCHHYIAIHGLYKDDLLEFWNRRGEGNVNAFTRYTEHKVSASCPIEPYLNWTVMGGMYRQEPKPCQSKPEWNINSAFKVYPGRERREIVERDFINDSIYEKVLNHT